MVKQIFKSVLIGILVGAALFMAPFFLLKFFLFFLIIGAIFRLIWGGKRRRHHWKHAYHWTNADHIRNMSEDEYKNYKEKWNGYNCGPQHYYGHWHHHKYNRNPKQENDNDIKNDKTE